MFPQSLIATFAVLLAVRAIVWGKLADYAKTLTKGSHLQIEGELRSREYQDKKNGNAKRRVWEVRVDSILKLDRAEYLPAAPAPARPIPTSDQSRSMTCSGAH